MLDTSVSLTWLLHNGTAEQNELARSVLSCVESSSDVTLVVPDLWWLEWTNAIHQAKRRRLIDSRQIIEYSELITSLGIRTESLNPEAALARVLPLAMEAGLTTYDATYLDLAISLKADLVTADRSLLEAAGRYNVATW